MMSFICHFAKSISVDSEVRCSISAKCLFINHHLEMSTLLLTYVSGLFGKTHFQPRLYFQVSKIPLELFWNALKHFQHSMGKQICVQPTLLWVIEQISVLQLIVQTAVACVILAKTFSILHCVVNHSLENVM